MALNQEIKERIFIAADELYTEDSSREFPNIEIVRQRSRAGMNYVVEAMKEWRAMQRKQVQAFHDPLPDELQKVLKIAAQNLWDTAQQLANESLDAARSAFEIERNDLIELSRQQSDAFETQAAELDAARSRIKELEAQVTELAEQQRQQAEQRKRTAEEVHRIAERMTRAENERDKAREVAAAAREDATKLQGELEAMKTQNAALLAVLKPADYNK